MAKPYPRRIQYAAGQRFFHYTITAPAPSTCTPTGRSYTCWHCMCDCGTPFTTTTKQIRRGSRKSCGCQSELHRFRAIENTEYALNRIIYRYEVSALKRKLDWGLTREEVRSYMAAPCHYCGSEPNLPIMRRGKECARYNGIDRIDSDKGYSRENCVTCCKECNQAKNNMPLAAFYAWITRLVKHLAHENRLHI